MIVCAKTKKSKKPHSPCANLTKQCNQPTFLRGGTLIMAHHQRNHPADMDQNGEISVMVNSTRSDFLEQSNDFIRNLPNASWISIDEEMTGISLPPGEAKKNCKDDSPTDRYSTIKLVPERYAIIQLGICLFEHKSSQDGASFHVRRYKFTLFPSADPKIAREITISPSSIHFLLENNMVRFRSQTSNSLL